jgi:hypothetical protein
VHNSQKEDILVCVGIYGALLGGRWDNKTTLRTPKNIVLAALMRGALTRLGPETLGLLALDALKWCIAASGVKLG